MVARLTWLNVSIPRFFAGHCRVGKIRFLDCCWVMVGGL